MVRNLGVVSVVGYVSLPDIFPFGMCFWRNN